MNFDKKYVIEKNGLLLAVADGIGGDPGGFEASYMALSELDSQFYLGQRDEKSFDLKRTIFSSIKKANATVVQNQLGEMANMGTTLSGVVIELDSFITFNAGDSRVYVFRDDVLVQITQDDTWVQSAINEGVSSDEANKYLGNCLNNYIGSSDLKINIFNEVDFDDQDLILICSDGIYGLLSDEELEEFLRHTSGLDLTVRNISNQALKNGGSDNLSIILLKYYG